MEGERGIYIYIWTGVFPYVGVWYWNWRGYEVYYNLLVYGLYDDELLR